MPEMQVRRGRWISSCKRCRFRGMAILDEDDYLEVDNITASKQQRSPSTGYVLFWERAARARIGARLISDDYQHGSLLMGQR